MQKIDPAKIANDVKTLIEKRATLKQMKGVTNDSFLKLDNPKPQLHAAECFLALGDKRSAASALEALNEYCPKDTDIGREYRAKAAKLREVVGAAAFEALAKEDEKKA